MKRLVCEMCGGTDIIKQDGVFVCQNCGMKYSVEDAKKMMIEGTVDVKGTVKVDTSDELDNLYQIARRAKNDNNGENAAKYYDMILVKDPASWEAAFYVVYFKASECKIAQIRSAAISVSNCEESVLTLIKDNVPKDEQAAAVKEVMCRSVLIANMLADGAKSHYDEINADIKGDYTQEYVDNVCAARDIMYTCGSQIDRIFGKSHKIGRLAADAWKSGIEMHNRILPYLVNKSTNEKVIASYIEKIGKYDSEYVKKSEKRKVLENELATLKENLRVTKNHDEASKRENMGKGIFFTVIGVIGFALSWTILDNGNELFFFLIFIISGLLILVGLFFILAGFKGRSSQEIAEEKRNKIASLESQIKAKQAEIDELKM